MSDSYHGAKLEYDASCSWREKYIAEFYPEFSRWMIFGGSHDGTMVDIHAMSAVGELVATKVPREKAERLIATRDQFVDDFMRIWNEGLPWYQDEA